MVSSVSVRTVTVISWPLRLDHTDPGVVTELPPTLRPITVTNVGSPPPVTHSQRVGGLVDVKGPD